MALTPERKEELRNAAGRRCADCGALETPYRDGSTNLHVHHRQRVKEGGGDEPENLRVLCHRCHFKTHSNLHVETTAKRVETRNRSKQESLRKRDTPRTYRLSVVALEALERLSARSGDPAAAVIEKLILQAVAKEQQAELLAAVRSVNEKVSALAARVAALEAEREAPEDNL